MKKIMLSIIMLGVLLIVVGYSINEVSKSRKFQLFGDLITSVATNEKIVALTFDDGPGKNTDAILDILNQHNIKATFYLTGHEIENHFEDAKKIVEEGHQIGNHSYSHSRMIFKSRKFIQEEIDKTNALIRQSGYEGEITFRPPYGRKLVLLPYYLAKNNMKSILWSIEPETDPQIGLDSKKIVEHVKNNIEPGAIILLHVMYESRQASLESVEGIITTLKEEGYEFVTVSELLKYESE